MLWGIGALPTVRAHPVHIRRHLGERFSCPRPCSPRACVTDRRPFVDSGCRRWRDRREAVDLWTRVRPRPCRRVPGDAARSRLRWSDPPLPRGWVGRCRQMPGSPVPSRSHDLGLLIGVDHQVSGSRHRLEVPRSMQLGRSKIRACSSRRVRKSGHSVDGYVRSASVQNHEQIRHYSQARRGICPLATPRAARVA